MRTSKKNLVKTLLTGLVISVFLLYGCNSRKEIPVTITSKLLKGDLSEYFEAVEGSYSLVKEKGSNCFRVNVQLKRTAKEFSFDYDIVDLTSRGYVNISCDLMNQSGAPTFIAENVYGTESLKENNIINLKPNETGWIEFSYCNSSKFKLMETTKTLSLRIALDAGGIYRGNSGTSNSGQEKIIESGTKSESTSTTGSEDWNSILNSYEKYINQYIALLKKTNAGDMSAMTEYLSMMEKATELAGKLENASDNLSTAQTARFLKLQTKLLNAASGL